jgi:hypothetical protein
MKPFTALACALAGLVPAAIPAAALACACGCGVFAVADPTLLPTPGAVKMFAEYDFLDQNENWSGSSSAPAADNSDKEIKSDFYILGGQVMVAPNWEVMAEIPFTDRTFKTIPDGESTVQTFNHTAIGDIRLEAMYTGFSADQSTGLLFGVKLPNGDFTYPNFDRDTEIGTGSTNLLLGGFHRGDLTRSGDWAYTVQALFDQPVASQDGYTPGRELDASAGVTWAGLKLAGGRLLIAPVLQLIASVRARDAGPEADPEDSGYRRLIAAPGVQFITGKWRLYGDAEIPFAQSFNGNQLVAPVFFKLILSRAF